MRYMMLSNKATAKNNGHIHKVTIRVINILIPHKYKIILVGNTDKILKTAISFEASSECVVA